MNMGKTVAERVVLAHVWSKGNWTLQLNYKNKLAQTANGNKLSVL